MRKRCNSIADIVELHDSGTEISNHTLVRSIWTKKVNVEHIHLQTLQLGPITMKCKRSATYEVHRVRWWGSVAERPVTHDRQSSGFIMEMSLREMRVMSVLRITSHWAWGMFYLCIREIICAECSISWGGLTSPTHWRCQVSNGMYDITGPLWGESTSNWWMILLTLCEGNHQ